MKVYRGIRDGASCRVCVVEGRAEDGTECSRELRPRPEMFAKPPGPFDWGSDGHGVVHLAAALLADLGADAPAMKALVPYFRRLLSRLPADGFEVSDAFLEAFAYALAANTGGNAAAASRPLQTASTAAPVALSAARNGE